MAHMTHNTVTLAVGGSGGMEDPGTNASNQTALGEAFSQGPLLEAEVDAALIKGKFNANVLNYKLDADAAAYWGLEVDWENNYSGAPVITAAGLEDQVDGGQAPGAAGAPGTAHTPTTASPSVAGSVLPGDLPAPPALAVASPGGGAFEGDGLMSPSTTSVTYGTMTLADYMSFGKLEPAAAE